MGRGITVAACLALLALQGQAAEPRVNVVADGIRGISTGDARGSVLVVFVMDDTGDPIDEVTVVVTDGGKTVESGKTDARGRVVFQVPTERVVSVRAEEAGLVPSVANGVVLRKGSLTGLALPLEEAVRHE
jgi:uncharacterized protein YfaS (alpha-2-macroglobulin family)